MKKTFTPCEDCPYSYSKNGQDMGMCEICELTYFANETKKLTTELKTNKQEWISVEDRLPNANDFYLCMSYLGKHEIYRFSTKHKLFNATDDDAEWAIDVTHWMALPQPPQVKGAE